MDSIFNMIRPPDPNPDTSKITIKLFSYGEREVKVDRDKYQTAKEEDRLDHLLDSYASNMDETTYVIEDDGNRFNLYA